MVRKSASLKVYAEFCRTTLRLMTSNVNILMPIVIIGCIQIFLLVFLFFSVREPFVQIFGPPIQHFWGPSATHYPQYNFILPYILEIIQIPLVIFVYSLFIGVLVASVYFIDQDKPLIQKNVWAQVFKVYIFLCMGAALYIVLQGLMTAGVDMLINRADMIRSTSGKFYYIKRTVFEFGRYFYILRGAILDGLFAYLVPILVIEQVKIFRGLWMNMQAVWKSLGTVFFTIVISRLVFIPWVVLENNMEEVLLTYPDYNLLFFVLKLCAILIIQTFVYIFFTIHYLYKRGS